MIKNFRFLFFLLLSLIGLGFTHLFLKPTEIVGRKNETQVPLAKLLSVEKNVKRQQEGRVMWEGIKSGEMLYQGDRIKTDNQSSAQIEFIKNQTQLSVEPNSIVIITLNEKNTQLRVLEGSLFVNNKNIDPNISIVSGADGKKELKLSATEASISVNKNGEAKIDVISAQAGAIEKLNFQKIEPHYGEKIYFSPEEQVTALFSWQALDPSYDIVLEAGPERQNLKLISEAVVDKAKGEAKVLGLTGQIFWRLVAKKGSEELSSPVMRASFIKGQAPFPVYPVNKEIVQVIENQFVNDFRWQLSHPLEKIQFVLASDSEFKNIIMKDDVSKQTFYNTTLLKNPGHYFWKVSGKLPGREKVISSSVQEFELMIGAELLSPNLLAPIDKASFFYGDQRSKKETYFSWKSMEKASKYKITLKGPQGKKEIVTPSPDYTALDLPPGDYSWWVQSLDDEKQVSKQREIRSFRIKTMGLLALEEKNLKEVYEYVGELPQVELGWKSYPEAQHYRFVIANNAYFSPSENFIIERSLKTKIKIPTNGKFYVQVEALGEDNTPLAKSPVKNFEVKEKPLPIEPRYALSFPDPVMTDSHGDFTYAFQTQKEKGEFEIEVRDSTERTVTLFKTSDAKGPIKNLRPGTYQLWARYNDEYGRSGPWSSKRRVIVPDKSSIAAPKIKGLKIR